MRKKGRVFAKPVAEKRFLNVIPAVCLYVPLSHSFSAYSVLPHITIICKAARSQAGLGFIVALLEVGTRQQLGPQ